MPSGIEGYEYDIFISYRQKDNQDGWVTDFVNELRREIGATFKERISIYFDENPYDGIKETHDVDEEKEIFISQLNALVNDDTSFNFQALDFAQQNRVIMCLLGEYDLYFKNIDYWGIYTYETLINNCTKNIRDTPLFKNAMIKSGLIEFWTKYGWSEPCRELANGDLSCNED